MEKDYTFSDGFMKDIIELLKMCADNDTDNIELTFDINGKLLNVNIEFSLPKASD